MRISVAQMRVEKKLQSIVDELRIKEDLMLFS